MAGVYDELYGPLSFDPAKASGRNPFGAHGGADTRSLMPSEAVQVVANTKGPQALLTPSGSLFWVVVGVGAFVVLNASARKRK